jgi:hypothetical protein
MTLASVKEYLLCPDCEENHVADIKIGCGEHSLKESYEMALEEYRNEVLAPIEANT